MDSDVRNKISKVGLPDTRKSESETSSCSDEGIFSDFEQESTLTLPEKDLVPKYTTEELSNHCDSDSCWIAINNKVYDVTEFIFEHPGGMDIIIENAGRDATVPFKEVAHSAEAKELLRNYFIGLLLQDNKDKRTRYNTC